LRAFSNKAEDVEVELEGIDLFGNSVHATRHHLFVVLSQEGNLTVVTLSERSHNETSRTTIKIC
jgi:hypothetical protein